MCICVCSWGREFLGELLQDMLDTAHRVIKELHSLFTENDDTNVDRDAVHQAAHELKGKKNEGREKTYGIPCGVRGGDGENGFCFSCLFLFFLSFFLSLSPIWSGYLG